MNQAIIARFAEYQPVTGTKYFYTSDQINSTRIITNSTGTLVYSAVFDPYGNMQKQWVNTYSPSLKFSGKERESRSEMDYFGARYYDHMRYRFISVDPVINKDEALVNPQYNGPGFLDQKFAKIRCTP